MTFFMPLAFSFKSSGGLVVMGPSLNSRTLLCTTKKVYYKEDQWGKGRESLLRLWKQVSFLLPCDEHSKLACIRAKIQRHGADCGEFICSRW